MPAVAGEGSCLLVDEYGLPQGTVAITEPGPSTSDDFTSPSDNDFVTISGFFYEDYYWNQDLTNQGDAYLDQYNGHSDGERGYHYRVTVELDSEDQLTPTFPYIFGSRFYGKLDDQAVVNICSGEVGEGIPSS